MAFPSISEIAHKCKWRKVDRASLMQSFDNISLIDYEALSSQVPNKIKDCWLVAKFGFQLARKACDILQVIPESLTDAQQKEVFANCCDVDDSEGLQEVANAII